ncbi:beta-ketoacyl synthase [Flavobacteriaceae bacterium F89]|uniref:Beta-ketoacyl synthase n=1 Tax=Cerina litoralis TaxID=2874477 RepID=A0AAE3JQF2_9FLAO|nr:beta-ketoacyl synthase N-terminal-like domain-containing protein [Cerina litoralis]MCG2460198.1 beta-ketoacyl synthase [Cerina litoralis]
MTKIYVSHNNIVSCLGLDSETVVNAVRDELSGLGLVEDAALLPVPFYASVLDREKLTVAFHNLNPKKNYTRLERMMILSLDEVVKASKLPLNDRVGLVIATTKGNIDALEGASPFPRERAYLAQLGMVLKDFFGFQNEAIVLSNACVSGILAISVAKRYIRRGVYDHVFVVGGDLVTKFILSGFNSFQALSTMPCKPYDEGRSGINIGEAAASVLVTSSKENLAEQSVEVLGEGTCNDANHISGPSRSGEGLYRSVHSAMQEARIDVKDIDFISAHGTATVFNDEMEAIAFNRLGLGRTPLNSLKGYFGHTLGASGLLETVIGMHSLHQNTLFRSLGYETRGTSQPLNVIHRTTPRELNVFLKTASGFGGCNTSAVFKRVKDWNKERR